MAEDSSPLGFLAEHAASLVDEGYVVVDGFLGEARAVELRREAHEFAASGKLPEHKFQFGAAQFTKPNIFEADLYSEAMREALPKIASLSAEDSLVDILRAEAPQLELTRGTAGRSLKLQQNRGQGGCFPWHYDNAGPPSKRKVTCIVYLNPDWNDGDGGEIELRPFLGSATVVPPLMDRAVLFMSDRVLHRVRQSFRERLCFTIWLDSDATNSPDECNLKAKHLSREPESIELLKRSPVQRALSRAVYAEAYEMSLRECMGEAPGAAEMVAEHQKHIESNMAHPQLGPFVTYLRGLRADASDLK